MKKEEEERRSRAEQTVATQACHRGGTAPSTFRMF